MIDMLKIKSIHELPCKIEKIDGKYCLVDEGVYTIDGELCCTQHTYNTLLNDPDEREKFNKIVAKHIFCTSQNLMGEYLENTAIKE